jgi:hypothetical protein
MHWPVWLQLREYRIIYWGPCFLPSHGRMIWLHAHPLLPPLPSVSSTGGTQEDWERETTPCCLERERGRARRWIIRPQESLVLCKSFNTLCSSPNMHAGRITAVQNSRHRELFFNQFASLEILLSGIFIVKIYILFKIQAASPQAYSFNFSEMGIWPSRYSGGQNHRSRISWGKHQQRNAWWQVDKLIKKDVVYLSWPIAAS